MDGLHIAAYTTATVGSLGFLLVTAKLLMMGGRLVAVIEKVPAELVGVRQEFHEELVGIRDELKKSGDNTLLVLQKHGEHIAVIRNMLNLDDTAQAKAGPRIRRRGRE